MLTRLASPWPSAVPVARSAGDGLPKASSTSSSWATLSGGHWMAAAMAWAPTSVSQQPRLPQWHGRPLGVEAQVADLAGVAAGALEAVAAGDDARTDADVAGDVDELVGADARAAGVLGQRAEVGVVGQGHRDVEPQRREHDAAERHVVPLEVGGEPDEAVAAPHQARDADPDADQRRTPRGRPRRRCGSGRPRPRRPARPRRRCAPAPGRAAGSRPPRPTRATTARSTPRSTAMT